MVPPFSEVSPFSSRPLVWLPPPHGLIAYFPSRTGSVPPALVFGPGFFVCILKALSRAGPFPHSLPRCPAPSVTYPLFWAHEGLLSSRFQADFRHKRGGTGLAPPRYGPQTETLCGCFGRFFLSVVCFRRRLRTPPLLPWNGVRNFLFDLFVSLGAPVVSTGIGPSPPQGRVVLIQLLVVFGGFFSLLVSSPWLPIHFGPTPLFHWSPPLHPPPRCFFPVFLAGWSPVLPRLGNAFGFRRLHPPRNDLSRAIFP